MTQRNPRVLHVVTSLGVGGVEVWLTALLRFIREREAAGMPAEQMDILMTGGRTAELDELARSLGAGLHYIPYSRKNFLGFAREFRRLLKRERYTAIHDHQDYPSAFHFLAGAGELPPIRIVHVHNPPICLRINTDTPARKALFRIAAGILRRMSTHVLGTSAQVLREYGFTSAAFPRQEIRSLHCGFDVETFSASYKAANDSVCDEFGWPRASRICLFAGRLEGFDPRNPEWNHKNPQFALEVVREAIAQGADIRFIVAGAGDTMRATLEKRVADWGLTDRIHFAGKRLDIPRLMAASHICIFPSLEEGLGMVAVEAQAAGLRVLASDTVPREAQVIPELMSFLPLSAGAAFWGAELVKLSALPRGDSSKSAAAVRDSSFSIAQSYASLREIYLGAKPSRKP